ncbi:MAG: hypothetical protein ACKO6F_05125, partial [Cyanobium sp.]
MKSYSRGGRQTLLHFQQQRQRAQQRWGVLISKSGQKFQPAHPVIQKLPHGLRIPEVELSGEADHYYLPAANR